MDQTGRMTDESTPAPSNGLPPGWGSFRQRPSRGQVALRGLWICLLIAGGTFVLGLLAAVLLTSGASSGTPGLFAFLILTEAAVFGLPLNLLIFVVLIPLAWRQALSTGTPIPVGKSILYVFLGIVVVSAASLYWQLGFVLLPNLIIALPLAARQIRHLNQSL